MNKTRVAVVMGGYSDEYKVSLKSGQTIYDVLNREKYEVHKVHILNEGWFYVDEKDERHPLSKADFSAQVGDKVVNFDVCFNIIHGTPGENGVLQAYWDAIGMKYTGCSFYQSALTFNKKDTLAVLNKYGIPSAKSIYLRKGDSISAEEVIEKLGIPFFVKPNQSGSSLGISKVKTKEEFPAALEKAFAEDKEILIESFLKGTEVSVGVVDYKGETIVLGITEIVPKTEFFDYEAKYNGASDEITPARLSEAIRQKVEDISKQAYNALGMKGFSRSEYIIMDETPFMLEMNTNPGFSQASILPQQAKIYGISLEDLCGDEVEKALKK